MGQRPRPCRRPDGTDSTRELTGRAWLWEGPLAGRAGPSERAAPLGRLRRGVTGPGEGAPCDWDAPLLPRLRPPRASSSSSSSSPSCSSALGSVEARGGSQLSAGVGNMTHAASPLPHRSHEYKWRVSSSTVMTPVRRSSSSLNRVSKTFTRGVRLTPALDRAALLDAHAPCLARPSGLRPCAERSLCKRDQPAWSCASWAIGMGASRRQAPLASRLHPSPCWAGTGVACGSCQTGIRGRCPPVPLPPRHSCAWRQSPPPVTRCWRVPLCPAHAPWSRGGGGRARAPPAAHGRAPSAMGESESTRQGRG